MSLRAQIEAIIYAAEEPVTLEQLLVLLKEELVASETSRGEASAQDEVSNLQLGSAEEGAPAAATVEEIELADVGELSDAESAEETEASAGEGELLNPKRAQREENKRHKALVKFEVEGLIADYSDPDRGIEIREVAGGYRMSTKAEHHELVRSFAKGNKPPVKLSLPALETLAVVAYKQPVTAPEIGEIRGVDSSGVLSSLLSRKLITTAGRKQVVGRPILYKTTKEFLLRFGLKDVNELPSMEEFEKMSSQSDMFEAAAEPESASGSFAPQEPVESAIPEDYAESV
ncbi:MAG: hypothetical protein NVS9B15_07920 [Acidobacteriaceae bacterium]